MSTYIQYTLEDGTTILIEGEEQRTGGVTKAGRDKDGNVIKKTDTTFHNALAGVRRSAHYLREQLNELKADSVEVTFGLKAIGEAGVFGISKVGMEANYTVKLTWNNAEE